VEALAGNRLSLSCVAKGNPVPSITWLKDGAGLRDQAVEVCVAGVMMLFTRHLYHHHHDSLQDFVIMCHLNYVAEDVFKDARHVPDV
jgi:hypothetical protein